MLSSDLGATNLCRPSSNNDGQFDTDCHSNDDGFCHCERSRTSSEESDSSDPRVVGDSPSPSLNLEEATRVRHEFHQAYPDLFQRRLAILKGLRHKSAPTYR